VFRDCKEAQELFFLEKLSIAIVGEGASFLDKFEV
jgi:hypothetical protein